MSEFFNFKLTESDLTKLGVPVSKNLRRLPIHPNAIFEYCLTIDNVAIHRCRVSGCGALMNEPELNSEAPRLHWQSHKERNDQTRFWQSQKRRNGQALL